MMPYFRNITTSDSDLAVGALEPAVDLGGGLGPLSKPGVSSTKNFLTVSYIEFT